MPADTRLGRPASAHADTWLFLDTDDDRVEVDVEPAAAAGSGVRVRLRSQLPTDAPSILSNFVVTVYMYGSPKRLEALLTEALEGVRLAAAKQTADEGR